MMYVKKEVLDELRKQYPIGSKVELVKMDDFEAPPVGTKGEVRYVDDAGTIHVDWENGSTLGVVLGEDECKKI